MTISQATLIGIPPTAAVTRYTPIRRESPSTNAKLFEWKRPTEYGFLHHWESRINPPFDDQSKQFGGSSRAMPLSVRLGPQNL